MVHRRVERFILTYKEHTMEVPTILLEGRVAMNKPNEEDRFPGVDPIPDPDHETPSSTDMIEDVLEEGARELKKGKHPSNGDSADHQG